MEIQKIDEETLERIKWLGSEKNAISHEKPELDSLELEKIESIKI